MQREGEEAVAGQEASARAGAGVRGKLQLWERRSQKLLLRTPLTLPPPLQTQQQQREMDRSSRVVGAEAVTDVHVEGVTAKAAVAGFAEASP